LVGWRTYVCGWRKRGDEVDGVGEGVE
jgi:hypothetical protein